MAEKRRHTGRKEILREQRTRRNARETSVEQVPRGPPLSSQNAAPIPAETLVGHQRRGPASGRSRRLAGPRLRSSTPKEGAPTLTSGGGRRPKRRAGSRPKSFGNPKLCPHPLRRPKSPRQSWLRAEVPSATEGGARCVRPSEDPCSPAVVDERVPPWEIRWTRAHSRPA